MTWLLVWLLLINHKSDANTEKTRFFYSKQICASWWHSLNSCVLTPVNLTKHLTNVFTVDIKINMCKPKKANVITKWTVLSSPRVPIDGIVWHLDVGLSYPGAVVRPKGWAVRPLKWYVSWVQNVDFTALIVSNGNLVSAISVESSSIMTNWYDNTEGRL